MLESRRYTTVKAVGCTGNCHKTPLSSPVLRPTSRHVLNPGHMQLSVRHSIRPFGNLTRRPWFDPILPRNERASRHFFERKLINRSRCGKLVLSAGTVSTMFVTLATGFLTETRDDASTLCGILEAVQDAFITHAVKRTVLSCEKSCRYPRSFAYLTQRTYPGNLPDFTSD